MPFFETSAKTSINITEAIETIVHNYLQKYLKEDNVKEKYGLVLKKENEDRSCW
jgi:hypothetical protein